MDEFSENFRREGGVVSDPKNFVAIFFALETALLVMNFRKNFKIGGVISDPKNFVANSVLVVMILEKIIERPVLRGCSEAA